MSCRENKVDFYLYVNALKAFTDALSFFTLGCAFFHFFLPFFF